MNLQAIIAIAVGLIIAGLGLTVKIEASALAKARTQLGTYEQQVKQDDTALRTAGDSLTAALAAVAEWKATCSADAAKLATAQADLAATEARLTASHAALAAAEAKDRATPACAALLSADLAVACPDVAGRLRQRPAAPGSSH